MLPLFSSSPASSSSWVCIAVLKPRRRTRKDTDDFVSCISSLLSHISLTSLHLRSHALLKAHDSNQVVVYSIWEHESHTTPNKSWGGGESRGKESDAKHLRRFLDGLRIGRLRVPWIIGQLQHPSQLHLPELDAYTKALSLVAHVVDMNWYEVSCWDCNEPNNKPFQLHDQLRTSPPSASPSCTSLLTSSSSPSDSTISLLPPCLCVGDVVHLRCITGGPAASVTREDDVLVYSCLAILKSFVHQMNGLSSYTFFKSMDGPRRMVGLGVWDGLDAASKFLYAPDGAPEECYWRSLGAKVKLGIYHVVFVSSNGRSELA